MENDNLPKFICEVCLISLTKAYDFQQLCIQSDAIMKKYLNFTNDNFYNLNSINDDNNDNKAILSIPNIEDKTKSIEHSQIENEELNFICNVCKTCFTTDTDLKVYILYYSHILLYF